ncbi:hypothetical protein HNQ34_000629 [Anoxybacillus tepidamans]|uniref:Uncharacterized protein n=1 Tax=Anoxybacteroides tepidamans TaxID=265948 RepID=A0A7W8IN32_9BACL|nr:hypothetical protein [Anoxybacillus tepidamans]
MHERATPIYENMFIANMMLLLYYHVLCKICWELGYIFVYKYNWKV